MRDINSLHPELRVKCRKFIELCKGQGIDIVITQTMRTKKEQDDLYKIGRREVEDEEVVTNLKYPKSPHCWGLAFDIAIRDGSRISYPIDKLKKAGEIAKTLGLTWGGDFKSFLDMPHIEVKWFSLIKLMDDYGTPAEFISTWTEEDAEVEKIKVIINGKEVQGFLKDGTSFIPARIVAEMLGGKVSWDGLKRTVTITK